MSLTSEVNTKWGKAPTPEMAFDQESETPPSIIDFTPTIETNDKAPKEATPSKQEEASKEEKGPDDAIPIKATTSRQVEKKGPLRHSERKHVPPKRYGIDLVTEEKEGPEKEVN